MESWVKHHREIFDDCILVDHNSTDDSCKIIKKLAPSSWRIVPTNLLNFDAVALDKEMMYLEESLGTSNDHYKLIINTTEFIFTYSLRETLEKLIKENPEAQGFGMRSFCLQDKEENLPFMEPVFKNRHFGWVDGKVKAAFRHWRFIHNQPNGKYNIGRHSCNLNVVRSPELKLCHFTYSPWGEAGKARKLQIKTRIPVENFNSGLGVQHNLTKEQLEDVYKKDLSFNIDLLTEEDFMVEYRKWTKED